MKTTTAFLVDRTGTVHSTHTFHFAKDVTQAQVNHLNPNIHKSTEGRYQYTLAEPASDDFLLHIEKLFETEAT